MRIDAGSQTFSTPFGQAVLTKENFLYLDAKPTETQEWATDWPCSEIGGKQIEAAFSDNGDLLDLDCNEKTVLVLDGIGFGPVEIKPKGFAQTYTLISSEEFNAWSTDVIEAAGIEHPAIR